VVPACRSNGRIVRLQKHLKQRKNVAKVVIGIGRPFAGTSTAIQHYARSIHAPIVDLQDIYGSVIDRRHTDDALVQMAWSTLKQGKAPDHELITQLVLCELRVIERNGVPQTFFLSGFPQTRDQAHRLGQYFRNRWGADLVTVHFKISEHESLSRADAVLKNAIEAENAFGIWNAHRVQDRLITFALEGFKVYAHLSGLGQGIEIDATANMAQTYEALRVALTRTSRKNEKRSDRTTDVHSAIHSHESDAVRRQIHAS
jgi:adenylate kinase family enzyme